MSNLLPPKHLCPPLVGRLSQDWSCYQCCYWQDWLVSVSSSLESELKLAQPICYTDSKVALYWILDSDKEWKQFLQNRVCEIRKLLPWAWWKHCCGQDNLADLPPRGLSQAELTVSYLWWHGPSSLEEAEVELENEDVSVPQECISEMKVKDQKLCHNLLVTENQSRLAQIIECQHYCPIQKPFGVTAYVLRLVNNLKSRTGDQSHRSPTTLTAEAIATAESLWIKDAQSHLIEDPKFADLKRQLELFRDPNGIWRCGGRI